MRTSLSFGLTVCAVAGWLPVSGPPCAKGQEAANAPAASAVPAARPIPIDDLFKDDTLWQRTADAFADAYSSLSLHWVTEKAKAQSSHPGLRLDRFRVWDLLVDFDQHQAAQIAGTSREGGTTGADMILTLRRIASAQKLNFQTYEDFADREFKALLTDYNRARGEILFTDTWGSGHELKRIPMDEAWSMTFGLFALLPRNLP